jgi:hypothetical protein
MKSRKIYDTNELNALLERVLADIGDDRFTSLQLLELEKLVRTYDAKDELPGKTLLRDTINNFRATRWPGTAPKPKPSRYRY